MGSSLLFMICCTYACLALYTSIAADTLTPNQNLTDGQSLVSSNQRFAMGFFKLGQSSIRKYLGIWYHNLPQTVVWVANKDDPVLDSSGHLIMDSNGALFLYNSSKSILWSTNETVTGRISPVLQLLDSGNLVVRNGNDDYAWQSFDHMSNTLLPGMRLGWKLKTDTNRYITSWKSDEDPSDGEFTFRLDSPEAPQLILQMKSSKRYRWGPFDGDRFSGSNELRKNAVWKPMFISNSDEVYYSYETLDEFTLVRYIVTQTGAIQYLTWRNHSKDWNLAVEVNREYCDKYGMCGPYGTCYSDDPNCRCLKGFVPSSPDDWRVISWSGGCKRRYNLDCNNNNGDGFVKYSGLKLPDNVIVLSSFSLDQCRIECLKNCNCTAYTAINVHGNGNGSRCVVWHGNLIDLRNFPNGREFLYIRMAPAELDSIADAERKKLIRVIVSIVLSSTFVLLFFALLGWYLYRAKRRKEAVKMCQQLAQDRKSSGGYQEQSQEEDVELPIFDLAIIFAATDQFAFTNKIGQGGFGPVYKGILPNGIEIAVKRLSQNSGQGLKEFKNEVKLIAKLQHRNLVRLLGCCIQGEERMLVYEYLPNRSLDSFIFDQIKRQLLPWDQRFSIVLGIARGLLYLHQDSRLRIIHRDLKSSNILLDSEMNPKISDFGIARIFGGELTEEKTRRIIGTYGYMSPEYAMNGHFSVKSDVFSFGVIVLEIISGMKNWGFYHPEHDYNLIGHTWKLWNEDNCLKLVDEIIKESYAESEVRRCIHVALLCVQNRAEARPTMSSVVFMLSNEIVELPRPKEPGFHTETSSKKNGSSFSAPDSNEMTYTTVDGR